MPKASQAPMPDPAGRDRPPPAPSGHALAYRPDIDGLRAVAVSFVILFHAFPGVFPGGFVGVDIFFVISGFLISGIILTELQLGRWSILAFYSRRIRRIFPALIVVLLLVLGYGRVILTPSELAQLGKHVVGAALFVANFVSWSEAGYFDRESTYKPLLHLWSLGVEEQFYLVWPLLLSAAYRARWRLGWVFGAVTALSLAASLALAAQDPAAGFFSPLTRVWELSSGGLLAWWLLRDPVTAPPVGAPEPAGRGLAGAVGLLLFLGAALFLADQVLPRGARTVVAVGCAASIIASRSHGLVRRGLSSSIAEGLGRISYPLYLWHWPLFSLAIIIRRRAPTPLLALCLIAASLVLAWLTARFVERPFRFGPHPRRKVALLIAGMVATALLGLWTWRVQADLTRRGSLAFLDAAKVDVAIADGVFRPTADMSVTLVDKITVARIGRGSPAVLLTGDSTIFQYGPRVQKLFEEGRLARTVYFVVGQSCSPIPGASGPDTYAACSAMARIKDDLVRDARIGEVIFGANWVGYHGARVIVDRDGQRMPATAPDAAAAAYLNLADEVRRLEGQGIAVDLILNPPGSALFDPAELIARTPFGYTVDTQRPHALPVDMLRASAAEDDRRIRDVAQATGARLLDPFPDVCGDGPACPILFGEGNPKFADALHLRPAYVRDHVGFLDDILTSVPAGQPR